MRYKINFQMDISVVDEKYPNKKSKKPIGTPVTIFGTEEELIEKINNNVYDLIDLATEIYENGEENVTI